MSSLHRDCAANSEIADLSSKMKELVRREEEALYNKNLENASQTPIADLEEENHQSVRSGLTIDTYSSRYTLRAHDDVGLNDYFYEDHVVAVLGDGSGQKSDTVPDEPLVGTVESSTTNSVSVVAGDWYTDETLKAYQDWFEGTTAAAIVEIYHPTTIEREREAIARIATNGYRDLTLSSRLDYLSGKRDPQFSTELVDSSSWYDMPLYQNNQQKKAIDLALGADPFACIHGPPGTGKTRVLVEIVRRLSEVDKSVLVTADSNPATDNILFGGSRPATVDSTSLAYYAEGSPSHQDELDVVRFNSHNSDHPLLATSGWFDPSCSVWSADIVVTTNNSAGRLADIGRKFDHAIVDEAGQATLPSTAIPYSIADNLILIGDHKQLPPFRHTDPVSDPDDLPLSMFEHLYGPNSIFENQLGVQLNEQYRMHPDIASLSNRLTYDGEISTSVNSDPVVGDTPIRMYNITSEKSINEDREGTSQKNRAEALCCGIEAKLLLDNGLEGSDIGIATPYRAQVGAIDSALSDVGIANSDKNDIYYDTITAFQGSERTAMICSFVRSNRSQNVGFLENYNGPNRLNVGLTRAKRHLTTIGDWDTLVNHPLYDQLYDLLAEQVEPITREGARIVDDYESATPPYRSG